uniref:COesterase domain-containing protein n=1 Tax=Macrostomum lignano TaxID=282301 RepID=A0A1I8HGK3_9PLAT
YRGEQLLENEDVILITVNYRLGALGFLFLDDEKLPGNFGLMDQRLALDFIQRVIPFFGGSRTQITLMGHGTDAASAGFHAVTDSKDFFDRMILMGGSPSMPLAWSSSTQKVLEDSEHFVNVQLECARGPLDSVLEVRFFNYTHPYDAWSKGEMDKPYMTGVGSDSGRYYIEQSLARRNISWESLNRTIFERIVELQFNYFPRFPERNTATGIQFLKLALTEWNYYDYNKRIKAISGPGRWATSDLLRAKQHDIHMYYIDVEDPLRVQEDLIGADHWGDIRYLFGEPLRKDLYPEVHKNLSRLMMHDFVQYIGGSAPSHWNATSQETSDFLLYDILQTDSGGPGNLVSVMVPDGFGLNTGRCPLWKNELPYVKSFVSAPFQEEETSKITVSASRKRPAIGKTSSVKDESEFNLYEVVSNYTVDVPGFGKVTGQTIMTLSNNITMSQFLGVRYAQPPVGNRRLAKPVKPHTTSDSKHLALTMPPMCIQREHHNRNMSEDCLYLNIWTPRRAGRNVNDIPVLVFIHGGFFEVGGISEDRWQGSMILDHYDAVVVTMNYRLGAFGFLSLDNKEVIGNYGLWDQEMALQWVADNIESFGGNKNRITLMGVEAGAVSIGYHMARPKQNRFHQVVLMTGSPYMSYPLSDDIEEVRDLQYSFLRRLRCPVDPAEALECIRSQPADSINEQQDVFQQLFQRLEFPPIIDGDFIRLDPWTMDPSTLMQVPMIFGGVDRPGNTFIERLVDTEILVPENFSHNAYLTILQSMNEFFPRYPKSMTVSGRTGLRNHFMQYNGQGNFERDLRDLGLALSDRYFTCANNKFLDAYSKASASLFTIIFEDAFYVFGNPSSPGPIVPDQQRRLSDAIMHAIVQFARTGRPSDLLKWDPYDSEKKSHLLLDADHLPPTMYPDGYRRQECGFWDHTLPFVNSLNDTAPPPTRPPIGPDGGIIEEIIIEIDLGRTQNRISIAGDLVRLPNGKIIKRFLGLPYAEMPLTRWSQASLPKGGNYTAKTMPPACPQTINPVPGGSMSEDCLYLNIWAPRDTSRSYPTAVFLHGGNYTSGANSLPEYRGEQLLENEDVILITVNYRLGALGFLFLDDEKLPGNFGLMDQRLALDFIQRVIPFFGGSRTQITLMGHGTDAASAGFHAVTDSKDFFDRMILMGGSPSMPLAWSSSTQEVLEDSEHFVNVQLDCARGPLDSVLECLRNLTLDKIMTEQLNMQHSRDHLVFLPPMRRDGYPEVHKDLSRLMMDDFVQYIGGSAPARWNRTSFQNSDFLLYDVVLPDSGGAGNVISVMVGDGFGLNSGRCPVWKNELPYVNTLVPTTTASEEENFVKLLSSSGERPARTPNLQPQRATPFNVHEVIANYTIQVPDFGHVRGHTIRTISNVTMSHFLGIPFAQPPVGNLRLAKPDKPSTTSDTQHIAQQMPPACMQMQNYNFTMSEDCLYLNVWTPKREGRDVTNLPVLVFLHGGFFEVGSVGEDRWQGSMILDHQDAVVVTINYRLGVFGFLSLDNKEVIGNYGLWDQEMALQWVADNIESFGGNKNRITLMGVEAGAVSIGYHMARPGQNRFHQVVLMTGSPYMSYPLTNDTEEARELQNISRFLGVPYAEPPVGDLRFAPPRAIPNSPGKFIAQTLPHACPQDNRTLGVAYSEDCLYLNIWTPDAVQGRNYPVIVYLHGGNFESGSISQRELFGENLLSYEDVVLVTVAYRLGAFGFLYLSDSELPGNMGLLDQRLALNEVKRYISMFGGDPENIALAGHGIGAAAVGFHSITASKQNFKRAIMMGGSPTMPMAWYDSNGGKENTRELNLAFVSLALGCPSTTISEAITCLKTLDTKNIVDAQTPFLQLLLTLEFRPVLDSAFFNNRDPLEAWRHQEQGSSNTEMLMGFTTDTGGSYVEQALVNQNLTLADIDTETYKELLNRTFPYHPRFPRKLSETGTDFINLYFDDYIGSPDKQTLLNTWGQAVGDRYFLCPVWETIVQKGRNQTSTETYLYVFTARDPWDTDRMQLGSDHQADLRYFFGIPAGTGIAYPESHRNLSVRMMRDIVKFVKDGKPNPSWQTTKLGVWDYADYNNLYSDRYNATEGASTIQRCGVWYYDLPYVDGLVKSAKKSPEPLRRKSALSLPDVTTNEAPKSDSIIPRRTRTAIRNYNVSVSGYGTVVGSTVLTTDNNTISEFLGVRYAQPPLGDLRFKKPEPLRDAGDGVTHLALEMGLPCYQRNYYNFANMSEDCLTLNIWTPRTESNPSGTYPVIVFIHGGFFEVGSSAESRWNGENILDHEQAVIVTINYRLGAFGFLALNSSMASGITGNMGLFDQEAAISWVAKNIEAFGGDKNAITLAGAEAGSISVGYHLLREPTANKPFHRVIMMTGSPIQSYPLSDKPDFVKQYHAEFVRTLNCSSDVVNCLQSLSADVINEKQEDFNQIFTGI